MRAAEVRDIEDVLALWEVGAENDARPADTPEAVGALIARDPQALLLAEDGQRIVGSLIAGWDGWRFHLYRLAVHPDFRRRGIGAALVQRAEERARDFGVQRADGMVLDDNALGHALWAAQGYRRQDEWSRWVKPLF